jgi:RimJ/RimL family protein N-acetyltransferase
VTPTLTLREVIAADLSVFYQQQADDAATQMAAFSARSEDAFLTHWNTRVLVNPDGCVRTVSYGDEIAGYVLSWLDGSTRLVGYWIGRAFWGNGIATGALQQFLGIDRHRPLMAHVVSHNIGSIRVLEKCGFEAVGEQHVPEDDLVERIMRLE